MNLIWLRYRNITILCILVLRLRLCNLRTTESLKP